MHFTAIYYILLELLTNIASNIVMAVIASTIGTARGRTQGSCLPWTVIICSFPSKSTVFCSISKVATGLKATLKYMSSPLLIPPCIPPLWFVCIAILLFSFSVLCVKRSFCSLPRHELPSNPSQYSNPFAAFMLSIAAPSCA